MNHHPAHHGHHGYPHPHPQVPPPAPAPINMTRKGMMEHERKMMERGRHHPLHPPHPYNHQKPLAPPMHHPPMGPPGLNPQYAHYLESLKYQRTLHTAGPPGLPADFITPPAHLQVGFPSLVQSLILLLNIFDPHRKLIM